MHQSSRVVWCGKLLLLMTLVITIVTKERPKAITVGGTSTAGSTAPPPCKVQSVSDRYPPPLPGTDQSVAGQYFRASKECIEALGPSFHATTDGYVIGVDALVCRGASCELKSITMWDCAAPHLTWNPSDNTVPHASAASVNRRGCPAPYGGTYYSGRLETDSAPNLKQWAVGDTIGVQSTAPIAPTSSDPVCRTLDNVYLSASAYIQDIQGVEYSATFDSCASSCDKKNFFVPGFRWNKDTTRCECFLEGVVYYYGAKGTGLFARGTLEGHPWRLRDCLRTIDCTQYKSGCFKKFRSHGECGC